MPVNCAAAGSEQKLLENKYTYMHAYINTLKHMNAHETLSMRLSGVKAARLSSHTSDYMCVCMWWFSLEKLIQQQISSATADSNHTPLPDSAHTLTALK